MAQQAPLGYVFYIAATPEKVWEGFVSPESNRIIFMGAELEADFRPGGLMAWTGPGPDGKPMTYVQGKVLRFEPPKTSAVHLRNGSERENVSRDLRADARDRSY